MISLIVLAAGESRRFGRNKLLMPILGVPMIRRIVKGALDSVVDEVVVVLGFEAEIVMRAIDDLPCRIVVNERYSMGMSLSVKVGFRAVSSNTDAVIILPGDYPLVDSDVIDVVVETYRKTNAPIVIASYMGRRGHPLLLSRALFSELMEINEETMGLKSILSRHEEEIVLAETGKIGVLMDVDVPEDINCILKSVNP